MAAIGASLLLVGLGQGARDPSSETICTHSQNGCSRIVSGANAGTERWILTTGFRLLPGHLAGARCFHFVEYTAAGISKVLQTV